MFLKKRKLTLLVRHKSLLAVLYGVAVQMLLAPISLGNSRFEVWTSDHGLPQNSVYSILQTRDGYLWFTTFGGLVRYDGVRFTVFNKSNSEGILSNRFTTLDEDAEGNLWIGTEGSGLTHYRNGKFITYTTKDGLPDLKVKAVRHDAKGRVWVFTNRGAAEWKDNRFIQSAQNQLKPEQISLVSSMWRQTGFSYFDQTGFHTFVEGEVKTYTPRDGLSSLNINSSYQDRNGTFWVETKDNGLNRLWDGKFTVYPIQFPSASDDSRISAVYEDRKGNLWIARRGHGLSRMRDGATEVFTTADGLASNDIETIYEDSEGNIWLGTFNNGLSRINNQLFKVYAKREGLLTTNVYPMLEDRAGNVWIGAWDDALYKFGADGFARYGKEYGLSYPAISALFEDASGTLWVGTFGGGINRFDGQRFVVLTKKDGLPDDSIRAITQDAEGNMWIGTINGLAKYKDGLFTTYNTADGLPDKEIQALTLDREGCTLGWHARWRRAPQGQRLHQLHRAGGVSEQLRARHTRRPRWSDMGRLV
jgi:ligand-binding sensor domain-containing protein